MNDKLKPYFVDIYRKSPCNLITVVAGCNTMSFVEDLKQDGLDNDEIEDFFIELSKVCLDRDVTLPISGYMNMVSFAAGNGLLESFKSK